MYSLNNSLLHLSIHKIDIQVPRFGVAKPDLLEIWHKEDGEYVWRVIDVKASKNVQVCTKFHYYLFLLSR